MKDLQDNLKDTCPPLYKLLTFEISSTGEGVRCLYGRLEQQQSATAAMSLACSIARRRLPGERLFQLWHSHATDEADEGLSNVDSLVLQAALLQNLGSPAEPAIDSHLLGLVAEGMWQGVIEDIDVGLGTPIRVEGHDWSVTDPGGDGLTVYRSNGSYCYRLWESKYHGTDEALKKTVNGACKQVGARALSYLARFSLVAQYLSHDQQLAAFYGRLTELWADKDPSAGVGIVIGTDCAGGEGGEDCFEGMTAYFELTANQHQGHLNLIHDFRTFAESVRRILWKGCGLWTEH